MVEPTPRRRLLAAVSVAQLATGVAGMVVALRRRHPYDVFWMHGRSDAIARDTILKGTALSAPVSNLLVQVALTAVVARRPSRGAARALGGLGALQVAGYLGERLVRRRLRPSGWDAVESPLVVAGIGLAGAMAALGSQVERRDGTVRSPSPVRARGRRSVREGVLYGGLPYLAAGQGPPLVVFSGLSAEHANPTGLARRLELQTLKPMARHFTVYAVNRKPGLAAGSTIWGPGRPLRRGHRPRVPRPGVHPGHLHRGLDRPAVRHRPPPAGPPAGAGRDRLPALAPRPAGAAPVRRAHPAGPITAGVRRPWPHAGGDGDGDRRPRLRRPDVAVRRQPARRRSLRHAGHGGRRRHLRRLPQLHRITAPTLLVAGGRDRFYSPELFRETAEGIPNARLRLYQDKGHAGVMTHKPAIREIVAFLRDDDQPRT